VCARPWRCARQECSGRNLDTKAVLLIGHAGAAASFLASRYAQPVLAAFAYAAYAGAAATGIWATAVRVYQDVPEPRQLFTERSNTALARQDQQAHRHPVMPPTAWALPPIRRHARLSRAAKILP
jgi:hypothetical protein